MPLGAMRKVLDALQGYRTKPAYAQRAILGLLKGLSWWAWSFLDSGTLFPPGIGYSRLASFAPAITTTSGVRVCSTSMVSP